MMKTETNFANLIEGNGRFLRKNEEFRRLSTGQQPEYVVVTCSDSRTAPTIATDSGKGPEGSADEEQRDKEGIRERCA